MAHNYFKLMLPLFIFVCLLGSANALTFNYASGDYYWGVYNYSDNYGIYYVSYDSGNYYFNHYPDYSYDYVIESYYFDDYYGSSYNYYSYPYDIYYYDYYYYPTYWDYYYPYYYSNYPYLVNWAYPVYGYWPDLEGPSLNVEINESPFSETIQITSPGTDDQYEYNFIPNRTAQAQERNGISVPVESVEQENNSYASGWSYSASNIIGDSEDGSSPNTNNYLEDNENPDEITNNESVNNEIETAYLADYGFYENKPSCNSLSFEKTSISLNTGESKTGTIYLTNNSSNVFYIDNVDFYDFTQSFEIYENTFENSIQPGKQASLNYRVKAEKAGSEKAYLQVYGHFESGSSCGFNDLETDFDVFVMQGKTGSSVFSIDAPENVSSGSGQFNVRIENSTGTSGVVYLTGNNGIEVLPQSINVGPNTYLEKTVYFNAGSDGRIIIDPDFENQSMNSRAVYVEKANVNATTASNAVSEQEENPLLFGNATGLFIMTELGLIAGIAIVLAGIAYYYFKNRNNPNPFPTRRARFSKYLKPAEKATSQ